jgi:hypothetical protein
VPAAPDRLAEPAVSRWAARIQVGTDQAQPGTAEHYRRGDNHSSLQDEWKLDGLSILEGERR